MAKIWTDEKLDLLSTYLRNSLGLKQIAKKFNTTVDSVSGAITRYGLSEERVPKTSSGKFLGNLDLEELSDEKFSDQKEKAKLRWQLPKTSKKLSKNKIKTALFWPDTHIPHQNDPVCKSILKLMKDISVDIFTITGDFMDLGCIGHWNKNRHKTLELQRLKSDYIVANGLLDEMDRNLPSNCKKYFLKGNHESVHKDTDLLTKDGWIRASEIKESMEIAQFNLKTGEITYSKPLKLHKHLSKKLIEIESNYSKQSVTLNHDVVLASNKVKAKDLLDRDISSVELRLTGQENSKGLTHTLDELRLLTWVIMAGTIVDETKYNPRRSKKRVQFKLSKEEKINKLKDLLNRMGISYTFREATKSETNKLQPYYIRIYSDYARDIFKDLDGKKEIPLSWLSLNKDQTLAVLETLTDTDASKANAKYNWSTISKHNLDIIYSLCVKNGFICKMQKSGKSGFEKGKAQFKISFWLNPLTKEAISLDKVKVKEIDYNDYAYCVTMPEGTIITRLNGKVAFTGNCWADQLLEEMPALTGLIEPEECLHLKERKYKVFEYNELLKIGRLYVTHGVYAGANPIKKHLDELKVNVLFGHTHTLGTRLSSSAARDIAFAGYNIGCACDLSPDYLKNKPNAWTHGFAIGYFFEGGFFDIQPIRIINGKFIFNGKIYDGNK